MMHLIHAEEYNKLVEMTLRADTIIEIDENGITFLSNGDEYNIYPQAYFMFIGKDIRLEFLAAVFPETFNECSYVSDPDRRQKIQDAMKGIDKELCDWLNTQKERWV